MPLERKGCQPASSSCFAMYMNYGLRCHKSVCFKMIQGALPPCPSGLRSQGLIFTLVCQGFKSVVALRAVCQQKVVTGKGTCIVSAVALLICDL